jgi:hypothetical protein
VSLPQVVISRRRVEELADGLVKWLESPTQIVVDLCHDTKNQDLVVSLTHSEPQTIPGKAKFELQYSTVAFVSGRWSFGVDQSCIRIFSDELRLSLEDLGRAT